VGVAGNGSQRGDVIDAGLETEHFVNAVLHDSTVGAEETPSDLDTITDDSREREERAVRVRQWYARGVRRACPCRGGTTCQWGCRGSHSA
jgi:hypothetical protein